MRELRLPYFCNHYWYPVMAFYSTVFVSQKQIPFDKIFSVMNSKATMNAQIIFKMSEERFQCIGAFRNVFVIQVVKHILKGMNEKIPDSAHHFMSKPKTIGERAKTFFIDE